MQIKQISLMFSFKQEASSDNTVNDDKRVQILREQVKRNPRTKEKYINYSTRGATTGRIEK